jgi:hypothetical protein
MDFDYKKYSLENLEKWMSDALLSSEATPQEIYDVIHKVVEEEYHYFKYHTGRCYDLLALLKGNGEHITNKYEERLDSILEKKDKLICDKDDKSPECQLAWTSFWEENYYPEEYSQYSEEELNAMCDKAESDQEKDKCREYNLREAEYYDKRAKLDANKPKTYNEMIADGWEMTADGFWWKEPKEDKASKWILPVQQSVIDGVDDYYVNFPDDLLKAANLKEGDEVEWVDKGDGSYILRKINKLIAMEEC